MASPTILIVEDEILVAQEFAAWLKALGYTVVGIATSGEEAVALVDEVVPDLILMDISLKGKMDGIEAADMIRRRAAVPTVYLTASADEATLQRARTTEPYGYIVKPFSESELRANIEMAVYRHQAEEDRRKLEARVQHTQKLESLCVLAGGIAHDFNNLLTSVIGYAGLAAMQLPEVSPIRPMLGEIEKAAQRAAGLAQQMLAYSGQGKFAVGTIRLDLLIRELSTALADELSKRAAVHLDLTPAPMEGDDAQIRQVIINLLTNASESLEDRAGVITVRTGVCFLEVADLRSPFLHEELPAGAYSVMEVRDSGCGMTEETRVKIFDPFFTTKFLGRGLGLAAVLGIVRGHHGTLQVTSKRDEGSTFQVYFPCPNKSGHGSGQAVR